MPEEQAETQTTDAEQEEFGPPPAPPVVTSEPTEPPEPLEVDDAEKGAQPEEEAERELKIAPETTPGEGPKPEEPVDEGEQQRLEVEEAK